MIAADQARPRSTACPRRPTTSRPLGSRRGSGSRPRPEPRAPGPRAGASRAQGYRSGPSRRTRRRYRLRQVRSDVPVAVRSSPAGRCRRPAAPCYTPAVLERSGARPANQEVSDRACMAHRPSREATERPDDGDPPSGRRRDAGDVYPGPEAIEAGAFSCGAQRGARRLAADAGHRDRRAPVGRRGQGQDDRLPGRADRRWSCATRAATTPATPWSAATRSSSSASTPSGVLYPHITSVIGNGVVVNPVTLIDELDMLTARGIDVARVRVSRSAHVIMPYHVALDQANEARLADAKVGTTGRGIGPTYGDRAWRLGLRMEDLLDRAVLRERIAPRPARQERPARRRWAADRSRSSRWSSRRPPGASGCATTSTTRPGSSRPRSRAASTSCSRAPRARCSTSTTAATRSSPRPTRSPAARAPAAGSGRSRSTRSSAS